MKPSEEVLRSLLVKSCEVYQRTPLARPHQGPHSANVGAPWRTLSQHGSGCQLLPEGNVTIVTHVCCSFMFFLDPLGVPSPKDATCPHAHASNCEVKPRDARSYTMPAIPQLEAQLTARSLKSIFEGSTKAAPGVSTQRRAIGSELIIKAARAA